MKQISSTQLSITISENDKNSKKLTSKMKWPSITGVILISYLLSAGIAFLLFNYPINQVKIETNQQPIINENLILVKTAHTIDDSNTSAHSTVTLTEHASMPATQKKLSDIMNVNTIISAKNTTPEKPSTDEPVLIIEKSIATIHSDEPVTNNRLTGTETTDPDEQIIIASKSKTKFLPLRKQQNTSRTFNPEQAILTAPVKNIIPVLTQNNHQSIVLANIKPETNSFNDFTIKAMDELALNSLISKFEVAYQYGNLNLIDKLLTDNVHTNEASSKSQLKSEYSKLFDITVVRSLNIVGMEWQPIENGQEGKGAFRVSLRERGASRSNVYTGNITIGIVADNNNLKISDMYYHYSNN